MIERLLLFGSGLNPKLLVGRPPRLWRICRYFHEGGLHRFVPVTEKMNGASARVPAFA